MTASSSNTGERLQKVLAQAGLASRREIERWIEAGRISIDGNKARLGDRVNPGQTVRLDGRPVKLSRQPSVTRVLLYNKPEGEICTRNDPDGRPTVFKTLPKLNRGRWVSVGRLDINTSGLLIFTNNGELANRLMHPRYEMEREYAVRVFGRVNPEDMNRLVKGIELEDGPARFDNIEDRGGEGSNHWYHVTIREGRQREVRRLWEAVGAEVSRLIRVRYGDVELPRRLKKGRWQDMEPRELDRLLSKVKLDAEPRKLQPRRQRRNRYLR